MKRWIQGLAGGVLAAAVAACGGASSQLADGGIGGTGISRGSVTSFGSVVVNARRFDTSAASFRLVGLRADDESALRVGLVARVEGDLAAATATRVEFVPDVAGRVASNAVDAETGTGTLEVLGQQVRVTPSTVVDGAADTGTAADFAENTRVLVSGFRDSRDTIVASYIGTTEVPGDDHVAGTIDAVNGSRFDIGGLTVDFSNAGTGAAFPGGSPTVGDRVRARGAASGGVLDAERVAPFTPVGGESGETVEVSGFIEDDTGTPGVFVLAGDRVDARDARVSGGSAADLTDDARVVVLGERTGPADILASEVAILPSEDVDIEATIDGDPAAGTVSLFGGELEVRVDARTRLRDDLGGDDRLDLADLAAGDCVEIDGYVERGDDGLDAADPVVAVKLEREDSCDETELEGPVSAFDRDAGTIELLGLNLMTDGDTDFDEPSGRDAFFDALAPGTVVSAEWSNGASPVADAVHKIGIESETED